MRQVVEEEDVMRRMPLIVGAIAFPLGVLCAGAFTHIARADETITVIEHATTDTTIDLGAKGDSVGDSLVFANDLYDAQDANKVGTDQGSCVRTALGKAWNAPGRPSCRMARSSSRGRFTTAAIRRSPSSAARANIPARLAR